MTSTARSDMRLASSWMVIASGMITSRMSFSFGSFAGMALQPLGAAAERGDRALAHFVGGERGDEGQAAALLLRPGRCVGLRARRRGARRRRAAADLARTFVLFGFRRDAGRRGDGAGDAGVAAWLRSGLRSRLRRSASWLPVRPCAWLLLRDGGDLPRPCCGLRRPRVRPARCPRGWRGAWLPLRRSGALRLREPWRRPARWRGRMRSSSVSVRSTTPERCAARRGRRHRGRLRLGGAALAARGLAAQAGCGLRGGAAASPGSGACRASRPRPAWCGHG